MLELVCHNECARTDMLWMVMSCIICYAHDVMTDVAPLVCSNLDVGTGYALHVVASAVATHISSLICYCANGTNSAHDPPSSAAVQAQHKKECTALQAKLALMLHASVRAQPARPACTSTGGDGAHSRSNRMANTSQLICGQL